MFFLKSKRQGWLALSLLFVSLLVISNFGFIQEAFTAAIQGAKGRATIEDRLAQYGPAARARLKPRFDAIGVAYPPKKIILVGLKQERQLEVWVSGNGKQFKHLHTYPILGASGVLGPKLSEGDRQVPEGLYRVELLNPNSLYHLSLRVNYPNDFDLKHARAEGRTEPGSDIMIHGKTASIGCLAMGDPAIEEIFVLSAETGIKNIEIILSPVDFRKRPLPTPAKPLPVWTKDLYREIQTKLAEIKP